MTTKEVTPIPLAEKPPTRQRKSKNKSDKKIVRTFKENDIGSAFALAIKNVISFGDTDIFPYPMETRMFEDVQDSLLESLMDTFNNYEDRITDSGPVNISTFSTVGYTGFRWATQIDPYWNVFFLGLVLSLSNKVESDRLSEKYVYSYRFNPDMESGSLFDKNIGWRNFQEDSLNFVKESEKCNYVITCDISDFYTRIYHHRLENALDRLDDNKNISSKIKKLIQQFSGTNSYGLPVGGPAARILAELSLDSIDHLLQINSISFKRYVDDFHIFCDSKESAHSTLTLLSQKLMKNEGLTLQKHKTSIMSKDEFVSLTQAKLFGVDEDEGSPQKARFMSLPIRYDPYSSDAVEQYESIKESLKDFDLLGLLSAELQKSKLNQSFSKQLIRAFSATDDAVLSDAYTIILDSINEIYPIFSTVIQVASSNWDRFDDTTKNEIRNTIIQLINNDSFILKTELNLAYAVKLLAKENNADSQAVLIDIYNKNTSSILINLVVTQAMTKWNVHYWLSDLKGTFSTMNKWQRRMFIIASYTLGDEGSHWRDHNKRNFNFIEKIYQDWAAKRKSSRKLEIAL